jgi:hypothetical protein
VVTFITKLAATIDALLSIVQDAIVTIWWNAVVFIQTSGDQHRSEKRSEKSKKVMTQFHQGKYLLFINRIRKYVNKTLSNKFWLQIQLKS